MNIKPNSKATSTAAACVLGGITAAGMYFNARYAMTIGHSLDEKIALGVVSVAFDAAKVLAFCYACHHLLRWSFLRAALAGVIWCLTATFAMYAAGSYAFGQLAHSQQAREIVNKELRERANAIKRLEIEIEDAKQAKSPRGTLIWASSGSCLVPTTPESKEFCHAYWLQVAKLDALRASASSDRRVEQTASPELMEWSRLTGLSVHEVMVGIALIFALIMEVVASVSGFAFAKNDRDLADETAAEQRRRNHEKRMAQFQTMRERNERRNAQARERRKERRVALRVVK